jgi:hypothetical protein
LHPTRVHAAGNQVQHSGLHLVAYLVASIVIDSNISLELFCPD